MVTRIQERLVPLALLAVLAAGTTLSGRPWVFAGSGRAGWSQYAGQRASLARDRWVFEEGVGELDQG